MNVLCKLTLAQIRGSKSRFVVTVIGVAVAAAMVAAVLLGCDSVMDAMRRGAIAELGDYHWQGSGSAASAQAFENSGLFARFGYACTLPYSAQPDGQPVSCVGVGGDAWRMLGAHAVEGELPDAPGEAAVTKDLATVGHLDPGSALTLTDPGTGGSVELTVTAVLDRFAVDNTFVYDGRQPIYLYLGSIARDEFPQGAGSLYFWGAAAHPDSRFFASVQALEQRLSLSDASLNSWYNTTLLTWMGIASPTGGSSLRGLINWLRAFLLTLIGVGAALMVSNAFSLSLAERRRTLGMLSSAGATPAQKSDVILLEALFAGLIGIPAGLLFACGGLAATFQVLRPAFGLLTRRYGLGDLNLYLVVRPFWLVISAAASATVLLLSAWVPALQAGRTTPIDAIRGTREIQLNARALRGGRLFGKLFGPEGMLARKNARRSIHRYRATLLSMTLSVVLLVTASAFALYLERSYAMAHPGADYNVTAAMRCYSTTEDGGAYPLRQILQSPANARTVREQEYIQWGMLTLPSSRVGEQTADLGWQYAEDNGMGLNDPPTYWAQAGPDSDTLAMQPYLLVLPDEAYAALAGQAAAADGSTIDCVVINRCFVPGRDGGMMELARQMALRPGDTMEWSFNAMPVTLRVAAVSDNPPQNLIQTWRNPYTMTLATSRTAADAVFARFTAETGSYCPRYFNFYYQSDDPARLYAELTSLNAQNPIPNLALTVTDIQGDQAMIHAVTLLVRVILYGFVALISLICAANIANTVSSGMALRRRETAMLCANGLTPRGLRKMLFLESGIYSIQALAIGLPVSALLAWFVWRRVMRIYYFRFTLPWGAMAAAAVGALGISLLAALPAMLHAARHPPAEDLRTAE